MERILSTILIVLQQMDVSQYLYYNKDEKHLIERSGCFGYNEFMKQCRVMEDELNEIY